MTKPFPDKPWKSMIDQGQFDDPEYDFVVFKYPRSFTLKQLQAIFSCYIFENILKKVVKKDIYKDLEDLSEGLFWQIFQGNLNFQPCKASGTS